MNGSVNGRGTDIVLQVSWDSTNLVENVQYISCRPYMIVTTY
jgi:hypothetical protein